MKENFLYIEEKDIFIDLLESDEITVNDDIIVFIEETKEVWTHGSYFNGSSIDMSDYHTKGEVDAIIEVIKTQILAINNAGYVTSNELPNFDEFAKVGDIPSTEGLATEEYVNSKDTAVQQWVNEKGYTTQEDIANIDFYSIKDNPIINDGDGRLVFADENGNIGLQIEADNTIFVKDVIAGDHALTNKMDIVDNLVRVEDTNGEVDDVPEDVCVKYVTQSLTEEQKNQVRENLGIPSTDYIISLFEQLKQMIENNNASDAIAVLDKAILDMHKLQ